MFIASKNIFLRNKSFLSLKFSSNPISMLSFSKNNTSLKFQDCNKNIYSGIKRHFFTKIDNTIYEMFFSYVLVTMIYQNDLKFPAASNQQRFPYMKKQSHCLFRFPNFLESRDASSVYCVTPGVIYVEKSHKRSMPSL